MNPYEEGKQAFLVGSEKCPYEPGTADYQRFAEGYCEDIDISKISYIPVKENDPFTPAYSRGTFIENYIRG